jgi:thiamine biosynthesis protein ThiI
MQFIVKLFPEITIKSRPVRKQFTRRLHNNLNGLLRAVDRGISVTSEWDRILVTAPPLDAVQHAEVVDIMKRTPGIANFVEVVEYPLGDFDDIFQKTFAIYGELLRGKTFVVRCKRVGQHEFKSGDVEKYVGGGLYEHAQSAGVDLHNPDVVVKLEIRKDTLYVVKARHEGLGGFPMGSLDAVLSLISGGFDSTVASFLTMKRGLRTHFVFFNLGGRAHEVGVKEVALYLWMKYSASHRVRFVAVPFENVLAEILKNVDDSQMGVILKRMMLRAADRIATTLEVDALVTGEAVAQVSSQTLANLSVIDRATDKLVLRPLITTSKTDIISMAREIGTEDFAANMPEYCGVISVNPTTRAKPERIAQQEANFDFEVLEKAIADAAWYNIDELANTPQHTVDVEVISVPVVGSVVIDVRHPTEQERRPLVMRGYEVATIPFYELHKKFSELDKSRQYFLYCDKGVMSRLHAAHLVEEGYRNVGVYRPRD